MTDIVTEMLHPAAEEAIETAKAEYEQLVEEQREKVSEMTDHCSENERQLVYNWQITVEACGDVIKILNDLRVSSATVMSVVDIFLDMANTVDPGVGAVADTITNAKEDMREGIKKNLTKREQKIFDSNKFYKGDIVEVGGKVGRFVTRDYEETGEIETIRVREYLYTIDFDGREEKTFEVPTKMVEKS